MPSFPNKMLSGLGKDWPRNYKLVAPTHPNWHWKCRVKLCWGPGDTCHHFFIIWIPPWEGRHHSSLNQASNGGPANLSRCKPDWGHNSNCLHHCISGWIDQSHCPTQSDRRGEAVHISCDHFCKELKFGNDPVSSLWTQWLPWPEEGPSRIPIWQLFSQGLLEQEGQSATKVSPWRN